MLHDYANFKSSFFDELSRLVPLLKALSENSQVFWLKQYGTAMSIPGSLANKTDVNDSKIKHFNVETEKILR